MVMNTKSVRNWAFYCHRYLGLGVGIIAAIIGITGSILVFYPELDAMTIRWQFGSIQPQGNPLPVTTLFNKVQMAFANQPKWKLSGYYPSFTAHPDPTLPAGISLVDAKEVWLDVMVNPFTGEVLGSRQWDGSFFDFIFKLHYQLLAGDAGTYVVGVLAFLMIVLSITGIMLWPGWRKLISGFQIKWNAHPKRLNFDLHKVIGVTVVSFLAIISFTGLCWNLSMLTYPVIQTVTLSPKHVDPVSKAIAGKSALPFSEELLARAEAVLPGGHITSISLPTKPDETFRIQKYFPQDWNEWGDHTIYFDRYSGEKIKVETHHTQSTAERFINTFSALHYGYFWGLPTRILYILIGLSPTSLLITGFIMWRYRRRTKAVTLPDAQPQLLP
jgi:uncharacterized iron-regulated membrane protein